jgi:lipopolysaccharide export system permease protein
VDPDNKQIKLTLTSAYIESPDKKGNLDIYVASAAPWKVDLTRKKKLIATSMTNEELRAMLQSPPEDFSEKNRIKFSSMITQRYSFAMASLAFAFVAVPLSLARHRKDSSSGILTAMMIGAAYFVFSLLGQKAQSPSMAEALLWAPNVLCLVAGLLLFHRVRFR